MQWLLQVDLLALLRHEVLHSEALVLLVIELHDLVLKLDEVNVVLLQRYLLLLCDLDHQLIVSIRECEVTDSKDDIEPVNLFQVFVVS